MSYQNQSDSNHFSKIIELKFEIGDFNQGHDRLILKGNRISVIGCEVSGTPFYSYPLCRKVVGIHSKPGTTQGLGLETEIRQ